jgi:type IV pilus assembly protein PilW
MKTPMKNRRQIRGVTLVELMIGMVLGLVLIGGLIQIFLGSRESFRLNDSVSRLQENGRFAIETIARDLRMAGLPSCLLREGIVVNLLQGTPAALNLEDPLDGFEAIGTAPGDTRALDFAAALAAVPDASWTTPAGTVLADVTAMPGADVLRVRRLAEFVPQITNVDATGADTIVTMTATTAISAGDVFVMCNGNTGQGYIVQACDVDTVGSATEAVLSGTCAPGNQVPHNVGTNWGTAGVLGVPREIVYFVGKRAGLAVNPPALFRRVDGFGMLGTAEELVEGVESLQILYGIDTSGNLQANEYLPANLVPRWDQVVSARIGLLLVSTNDNVVPGAQADITMMGTTFQPPAGDRRLRQAMVATVTLRNRAP